MSAQESATGEAVGARVAARRPGAPRLLLGEECLGGGQKLVAVGLSGEAAIPNLEKLAEVGVVLVARDFGEGLLALLGHGLVEVAALTAGMQVMPAGGTGVSPADLIADDVQTAAAPRAPGHNGAHSSARVPASVHWRPDAAPR